MKTVVSPALPPLRFQPLFKPLLRMFLGIACLLPLAPSPGHAAVLTEDFGYSAGSLAGNGTATGGWTGAWTGNTNNGINTSANLTISGVTGYSITQTGTGYLTYGSSAAGNPSSVRSFSPFTEGEFWFSVLLHNPTNGRVGLHFNVVGDPKRDNSALGVLLVGNDARYVDNGGFGTDKSIATLPTGATHLVIGRVVLGTGVVSLWFDPANVTSPVLLDTPFNFTTTGNIASGMFNVGVETYSGGQLDALRIGSSLNEVVGLPAPIPEPATALLLLPAGLFALGYWRKQRRSGF